MIRMNIRHRQRGVTLVLGLIFLVALTLLGVMAMKNTLLQERMAGGSRDRSLAFQAAEAALRDAKRDILALRANGAPCVPGTAGCRPATDRPWQTAGMTPFTSACTNGQCYDNPFVAGYGFGGQPAWVAFPLDAAPGVVYGTFTFAAPIAGVAAQPRYLIEIFARTDTSNTRYFYRITARAVGANPNTAVLLQEVFAP
ncbi:MAG: PilX N-terminal domain-containing pilus assembly protein [Thiobacillus sp.]